MNNRSISLVICILALTICFSVKTAYAGSHIINHTNFYQCDRYSVSSMQNLKHINVYFAHASVGWNILNGMKALNEQNSQRFPMTITDAGDRPNGTPEKGKIYQHDRGNPGCAAKISQFAQCVRNGWHNPAVNVVVNKFCYIDPDTDFNMYVRSMEKLVKFYPSTAVVFTTIPLCNNSDNDNVRRNVFNQKLRAYAKSHNAYLLDIADIEAYHRNGTSATFHSGSKTYQQLCSEYTSDGGHLNDLGSLRVAKGFYTLLTGIVK